MDFVYSLRKSSKPEFRYEYVKSLYGVKPESGMLYIEKLDHLDYRELSNENLELLIGDIVQYGHGDQSADKGFFYKISWDHNNNIIKFFSDFHSFLPIYITEYQGSIVVSSSADYLYSLKDDLIPNPDFFHQMAMYNMPIGDTCFFLEVKRVKYGQHLSLDKNGLHLVQDKRFYEHYAASPVPYKKALPEVVESFVKETKKYYGVPCYITLTGGFDGRTATAVAHYYQNDFITYSHGKPDGDDVYIPMQLSQKLSFPYQFLELGEKYVENYHGYGVNEHLKHSGGMNGFLYPHVAYGANCMEDKNRPIINGYVGSELLASVHYAGALISRVILDIVAGDKQGLVDRFINDPNLEVIKNQINPHIVEKLISEVGIYIDDLPKDLLLNQKLSCFEFEEIIPKLFGTWVYSGMHYARVRSPFTDNAFLATIVKTEVSQFYRDFLEKNPFKRFWGQYLYSNIINKTWPEIGREMSGKGYAPADLLNIWGRIKVAKGYVHKEKKKKSVTFDNLGLISGMQHFLKENPEYQNTLQNHGVLLQSIIKNEKMRDFLFLALSHKVYSEKR